MTNRTVSEVMSTRELATVEPSATIEAAKQLTEERGISHLLVMQARALVGVVCICDFDEARVGADVRECLGGLPTTVQPSMSVLDAAGIMTAGAISCLPVIDGGELVGVVTRADLRRAGVGTEHLGIDASCSSCGTTRHVRAHGAMGDMALCLDCRRQSEPPHWTEDLGRGS